MSEYHYYATTAFGWATAGTRAKAIADAARFAGSDLIKRQVKSNGGLYCWTCRIRLPESAAYTIEEYVPRRVTKDGKPTDEVVPVEAVIATRIQNMKGHVIVEDLQDNEEE